MSEQTSTSPTTRLIFKNVPLTYTEQDIRDELVRSWKQPQELAITYLKMLQRNNKFCGICFVGFKTIQQATAIYKYWNHAYWTKPKCTHMRTTVDYASTDQQAWSKYNDKSLVNSKTLHKMELDSKQRQERAAMLIAEANGTANKKKNKMLSTTQNNTPNDQYRQYMNHPSLFGLSDEDKMKLLTQPKFFEFLGATKTKAQKGKFWDNELVQDSMNIAGINMNGKTLGMISNNGTNVTPIDDDDDEFFQGPGLNGGNTGTTNDDQLIKVMTIADQEKLKQDKIDEKQSRREEKAYLKAQKVEEKRIAKENKLKLKEEKKLAKKEAKTTVNVVPKSDADFLKMAMGGFSSDEEDMATTTTTNNTMNNTTTTSEDETTSSSSSSSSSSSDSDSSSSSDSDSDSDSDTDDENDEKNKKSKTNTPLQNTELVQLDQQEDPHDIILSSGSIFVRNLPFQTKESELSDFFSEYGEIAEILFGLDRQGHSVGYATIIYRLTSDALTTYKNLNGKLFQGRFLHLLPGKIPESQLKNTYSDDQLNQMTHKRKKLLQLKNTASSNYNWNSLFIAQDTIANAVSAKLKIEKGTLLGADAENDKQSAAVRMAIAETHIINETKTFLEEHGVKLEKFTSTPGTSANTTQRSNTVILIKNIPYTTEDQDLRKLFSKYGTIDRLILPPYKTMAIIEMLNPIHAKSAFLNLSYRKLQDVPIYLEWGPKDCLIPADQTANKGGVVRIADNDIDQTETKATLNNDDTTINAKDDTSSSSIFVKNIEFNTTDEQLQTHFTNLIPIVYKLYMQETALKSQSIQAEQWRVRTCRIMRRTVTNNVGIDKNKQIGELLSLGYGFVEMSHPQAAKAILQYINKQGGTTLQGHLLACRLSKPSDDTGLTNTGTTADLLKKKTILIEKGILSETKLLEQQKWSKNNQKVIVRNIPFEATTQEIRETFQAFGQIKRCTIPNKVGTRQGRGYAFIEFINPAAAQNAFEALKSTHILGRHLVIEWAKPDETIEDMRANAKEAAAKMKK